MAWSDGLHINAVSQWTSPETGDHFVFASVQGKLCRISANGRDCFTNGALEDKANAGAVIGDNYYYGRNVGDCDTTSILWVSGLGEAYPTFHTDKSFLINGSLFQYRIIDFAPLAHGLHSTDALINDDMNGSSYLIGIGGGFEVFISRIATTGAPESYAVLDGTTIDWDDGSEVPHGVFGAAFAYQSGNDAELFLPRTGAPAFLGWSCLSQSPRAAGTPTP
jgi:hypothetical protein